MLASRTGLILFTMLLTTTGVMPGMVLPLRAAPQESVQTTGTSEADRILEQGKTQLQASQYKEALLSFQQALTLYQQLKDGRGEAEALRNIGNVFYSIGDAKTAIDFYQQSLAIAQKNRDYTLEASALQNLGVATEVLGDYSKAITYQQQSLAIYQKHKDRAGEAYALGNLGSVYLSLSDYAKAADYYQQSLTILREIKDRKTEGSTLGNLGLVYYSLGDYNRAIDYARQHLAIVQERQDRYEQAAALNNLGNSYFALGDYAKAVNSFQQSLTLARQIGNRLGEAQALGNLGVIYTEVGDYAKAVTYHQQNLKIAQELKNRPAEGQALGNLGNAYLGLGDFNQAVAYHQKRLAIARELGDRLGEAKALNNLGNAYKYLGSYARSMELYQQTLVLARTLKDPVGESTALINLGVVASVLKDYAKAIDAGTQALAIARALKERSGTGIALNNLGNTLFLAGDFARAETTLVEAVQVWETLRANLGSNDANKVSIFDQQARTYRLLQRVLVAQNKIEPALEIAERGRARAFVELLARRVSTQPVTPATAPPTIEQIKQVAKVHNATLVQYSITYEDLLVEGKEQPRESELLIWVIKPTGEIALRRVDLKPLWQQATQEEVYSSVLEKAVAKTRRSLGVGGRGLAFKEDSTLVTRASTGSEEQRTNSQELQQLHQLLIQPIAELLPTDPNAHVIFVPQGPLFLAPFAALQDAQGRYLIEQHTILSAPSIQVLELTRQQRQNTQGIAKDVLVVGNPAMPTVSLKLGDPPQQLPSLPGAEVEAQTIAALLQTKAVIGNQATKAAVIQRMSQARLIHLATHGLLDDVRGLGVPGAVALAPARGDDGLLTASEILKLRLNAELVILSACDTGQGRITGDGVIGLSRSLISAGAPSVIVSLWKIPDDSTASLMSEFYRQLPQQPDKAQALRQAMLKTMQQFPDPRDWAAFVLIGEAS